MRERERDKKSGYYHRDDAIFIDLHMKWKVALLRREEFFRWSEEEEEEEEEENV